MPVAFQAKVNVEYGYDNAMSRGVDVVVESLAMPSCLDRLEFDRI